MYSSPAGRLLILTDDGRTTSDLLLTNVPVENPEKSESRGLRAHKAFPAAYAFDTDGQTLLTGDEEGTLVW